MLVMKYCNKWHLFSQSSRRFILHGYSIGNNITIEFNINDNSNFVLTFFYQIFISDSSV